MRVVRQHSASIYVFSLPIILIALLASACTTISTNRKCDVSEAKYGSPPFQVSVSKYFGEMATSKSLLIMPPTGGTNYIDRSYARQFCAAGYDVYVLNSWTDDTGKSTELEIHQGYYSRMLDAVQLVTSQINSPFIGMLGTSLGGLYSAVATSKLERLDAVFVIAAGAPVTSIIVKSDQQAMRHLATTRKKRHGFANDDEYLKALGRKFQLEPMTDSNPHAKKDLGMVIAEDDTTVPTEFQHRLRDYWKPQMMISVDSSHFWTIIKTWLFHDDEIVSFFDASAERHVSLKSDALETK